MKRAAILLAACLCGPAARAWTAFELMESGKSGVAALPDSREFHFFYVNPSSLGGIEEMRLDSHYARLFYLEELAYFGSAFAVPVPGGGVGLGADRFGNDAYRENRFYVSAGFRLSDRLSAGASLKAMLLSIDEFGAAQAFGADVGVHLRVTERLSAGMTAINCNRPAIGSAAEALPSGYAAGLSFLLWPGWRWAADLEQVGSGPASLSSALDLQVPGKVFLRGGFRNRPAKFLAGLGVGREKIRMEYSYEQALDLPGSHRLTVSLGFGRRRSLPEPQSPLR